MDEGKYPVGNGDLSRFLKGEIYSGVVGGEFVVFEAANLWRAYASVHEWFEESEALREDIKSLATRETVADRSWVPITTQVTISSPRNRLTNWLILKVLRLGAIATYFLIWSTTWERMRRRWPLPTLIRLWSAGC